MECMHCGASVAESARFCTACGCPLTSPCPACGAPRPHSAKFCGACGASVTFDQPEVTRSKGAVSNSLDKVVPEAAHLLEKCRLFRSLDDQTRWQLAARAHRYRFACGEAIFEIGAPGQTMLAVVTGTVRIIGESSSGREIVLADLNAGEVFGEIALLDGRGRSARAIAQSACELLVLERRDVLAFLENHPKACLKLLETLCERLRHADDRITDVAFSDLSARLAKVILGKAVRATGAGDPALGPRLALSQRELAMLTGGTRESVNRCLRDWRRRGIVHLKGGWIVIDAPTALESIAEPR